MSEELCALINGGILGMLGQGLRLAYAHYYWVMLRKNETYFWRNCQPVGTLLLSFFVGFIVLYQLKITVDVAFTITLVIVSGALVPFFLQTIFRILRRKRKKSTIKLS